MKGQTDEITDGRQEASEKGSADESATPSMKPFSGKTEGKTEFIIETDNAYRLSIPKYTRPMWLLWVLVIASAYYWITRDIPATFPRECLRNVQRSFHERYFSSLRPERANGGTSCRYNAFNDVKDFYSCLNILQHGENCPARTIVFIAGNRLPSLANSLNSAFPQFSVITVSEAILESGTVTGGPTISTLMTILNQATSPTAISAALETLAGLLESMLSSKFPNVIPYLLIESKDNSDRSWGLLVSAARSAVISDVEMLDTLLDTLLRIWASSDVPPDVPLESHYDIDILLLDPQDALGQNRTSFSEDMLRGWENSSVSTLLKAMQKVTHIDIASRSVYWSTKLPPLQDREKIFQLQHLISSLKISRTENHGSKVALIAYPEALGTGSTNTEEAVKLGAGDIWATGNSALEITSQWMPYLREIFGLPPLDLGDYVDDAMRYHESSYLMGNPNYIRTKVAFRNNFQANSEILFELPIQPGLALWELDKLKIATSKKYSAEALRNLKSFHHVIDSHPELPFSTSSRAKVEACLELIQLSLTGHSSLHTCKTHRRVPALANFNVDTQIQFAQKALALSKEILADEHLISTNVVPLEYSIALFLPVVLPALSPFLSFALERVR